MNTTPPIQCEYDGEAFVPKNQRVADKFFVVGETYPLVVHEDRSQTSHNHFFASVAEAWKHLPDEVAERLPTPDHLRRFALIKAGYRDERSITCASKAEALRIAAFVRPIDDFAFVSVNEATVSIFTAKSQSMRAMGKAAFQKSKDDVLTIVASMIGTDPATLSTNTNRAA